MKIRIRVWDKLLETMHYDVLPNIGDNEIWCDYYEEISCWEFATIIQSGGNDRFNVMLNTLLKDKNGKKIYEGDIVRWNHDGEKRGENIIEEMVELTGGAFYPVCNMPSHELEVIGNIYENPELLKETK